MRTVPEIIEELGGVTKASEALSLKLSTVSSWKSRGSIPPRHWHAIIKAAKGKVHARELLALNPEMNAMFGNTRAAE